MGSSTNGKKHKKEKKHKRHSLLDERHHHKKSKKKDDRDSDRERERERERERDSSGKKHIHHRHHHHRHHHHHHERRPEYAYEKIPTEVIDLEDSDSNSDSSDCVEVPLATSITSKGTHSKVTERQPPPPPPPNLSKTSHREYNEYSSLSRPTREEVEVRRVEGRREREELRIHREHEDVRTEREEAPRRETREESRREIREEARREIREDPRREIREDPRREIREETRREVREEPRCEIREEARREVREDARREIREDPRREIREEPRREIREEPRREIREEVRREVREDPRREVREEARREIREDPRRETREEPRRDTREEPRRETREDPRKDVRDSCEGQEFVSSRHRDRPTTPPPPKVSLLNASPPSSTKRKYVDERDIYDDGPSSSKTKRKRSPSQAERHSPENGAGDVLSIVETNKLRAKLGLKPLEVNTQPTKQATSTSQEKNEINANKPAGEKDLSKYKDEWGEFWHKPADNLKQKAQAEKLREKFKQHKEKRFLEERLQHIKTLGESDEEVDDVSKWVQRSKRVVDEKKEAERRAKALEEMDAQFGVDDLVKKEQEAARRKAYNDKHLKGLRVEHDIEDFSEGKTIILTLKDKEVLNEEDDALVNLNMIDNERYRKNVMIKKQNPQSYGYDVYEEQYDQFGNPIDRGVLAKYDEDLDGNKKKKKDFVIGEDLEYQKEQKRKLLELQTKLAGKRLETLNDLTMQLATDTYSETELSKFKKPKKKVRKIRQTLKADDLEAFNGEVDGQHLGSRNARQNACTIETESMDSSTNTLPNFENIKIDEDEDDNELQRVLNKARKLKQKENIIKKLLPIDIEMIKSEVKTESDNTPSEYNIVLNSTAEFCRTLGDIPTYGMSGNRNVDESDRIDYEVEDVKVERHDDSQFQNDEVEAQHGTWNSVNPEDVLRPVDLDITANGEDIEDIAILDEEPDVGAGVANALRLALSKGYLEKEERKRPSNSKMAHLQAKNYSIEDKSAADDEKVGRRDRYHAGPITDFKDKDNFKPNVKLEYIDDNGRILNLKEAFRYLSHKFHGKGPGKNKIEKRLKKMEQEGLMKTMSSTDTPLGTLTMLQQKQKETKTPYVVLSGGKQIPGNTSISKYK